MSRVSDEQKAAELPEHEVSEQMRVRRDKRDRLLDEGRAPYPVWVDRTHTLAEIRTGWDHLETGEETEDLVGVGGRVVFLRNTGKLCFATLQGGFTPGEDASRLQVMLSKAEVGDDALAGWKADVDLGDWVYVHGRVIRSKRGELSVLADRWEMASKALRPMPTLHHELSEETRVRQRYADLEVRPEAQRVLRARAAITRLRTAAVLSWGSGTVASVVIGSIRARRSTRSSSGPDNRAR